MANKFTDLDFESIKAGLKDFLKAQSIFKDYDFEGSGLSVLLDLLAHNTEYTAFYANMLANEMYLDSAQLRKNVVSRAKALGYVPTSSIAPYARLRVRIELPYSSTNPSHVIVPIFHQFMARFSGAPIFHHTMERYIIPKVSSNSFSEVYSADITVYETTKLVHKFYVDRKDNPNQRYILPNVNIDFSKIFVTVTKNQNGDDPRSWFRAVDTLEVKSTDRAFWVQENENSHTELYFGDGYVGKRLDDGNVVEVTYFVTNGSKYHGLAKYQTSNLFGSGNVQIEASKITIETLQALGSGEDIESTDSIKFKAPLYYDTQSRAVTKSDYETILLKDYPQIEHIRVWGGEDNDPPTYGVVYAAVKPKGALAFNSLEKTSIKNILKRKNIVSIQVEIVDPDYLYVTGNIVVKYNGRVGNKSAGQIETSVRDAIDQFSSEKLSGFDTQFRYSTFSRYIDSADPSIVSNLTNVGLKFSISPQFNVSKNVNFSFQSSLDFGDQLHNVASIRSSSFLYNGFETFIQDDGNGVLYMYRLFGSSKIIVNDSVGTVNYDTGQILIPDFKIQGIPNGGLLVYFYATPKEQDFFSIRNRILLIDQSDIKITAIDEQL